jgi:hypothetical protein
MIILIDGLTGSGKSWLTTQLIHKEWKRGAHAFLNYQVNFSADNDGVTRWHNLDELYHLKNGVIGIDDAFKLLAAENWRRLPTSFAEKIIAHRHDHVDIITNIQDFQNIDYHIRRNVHERHRCYSIFRFPVKDRVKPYLQLIVTVKKIRKLTNDTDRILWQKSGATKFHLISRYWTKELYGTYQNIYLDRYICATKFQKKIQEKKGSWLVKIYRRDLVNSGKAKI